MIPNFKLANTEFMDLYVQHGIAAKLRQDNEIVRELLSRWVSECPSAIALNENNEVIGLCNADVPLGTSGTFILRIKA